jgi:hypothetical protein
VCGEWSYLQAVVDDVVGFEDASGVRILRWRNMERAHGTKTRVISVM